MRLPRFDRTTVTVVIAAVLLGAAYWVVVQLAQDFYDTSSPTYSVYNTKTNGLSVYFRYLGELGLSPKVLRNVEDLPKNATIVVVGPFDIQPSGEDTKRFAEWVRGGGRLVLAGSEAGLMLVSTSLTAGPSSGSADSRVSPTSPSVYAQGVRTVAPGGDRLRAVAPEWVTLFADGEGGVLLSATLGKGEVLWLAGPYAISNAGIGRADNARLAAAMVAASPMPIYFDEYHHGFTSEATLWTRLGAGGQVAVLLAAFALAALLVARGRRLGPALAPREESPARTAAYISSLAELYRKAGARAEALEALEDGLARALARRHGTVVAGLARRPQASEAIEHSRALRRAHDIARDEFLTAARRLRRARREVEGHRG
jgi:hypothetical protein